MWTIVNGTIVHCVIYCNVIASTAVLPEVVDLDNCLQEEILSSERLSKLFEVPSAPVSSPILKKSHSDGNVVFMDYTKLVTMVLSRQPHRSE